MLLWGIFCCGHYFCVVAATTDLDFGSPLESSPGSFKYWKFLISWQHVSPVLTWLGPAAGPAGRWWGPCSPLPTSQPLQPQGLRLQLWRLAYGGCTHLELVNHPKIAQSIASEKENQGSWVPIWEGIGVADFLLLRNTGARSVTQILGKQTHREVSPARDPVLVRDMGGAGGSLEAQPTQDCSTVRWLSWLTCPHKPGDHSRAIIRPHHWRLAFLIIIPTY